MTLAFDIETVQSDVGLVVDVTGTPALSGLLSLQISNSAIFNTVAASYATARLSTNRSRGFTTGKIRTMIRIVDAFAAGTAEGLFGCLCMMNQADVGASGGACYAAGYHNTGTPQWRLVRFDNGIGGTGTATNLETGDTTFTPAEGNAYAMEIEWNLDENEFSGLDLVFRVGESLDFSDLTEIYRHTDATPSHLTTSVGEGLIFIDYEGGGDLKTIFYDDTTFFSRLAVGSV